MAEFIKAYQVVLQNEGVYSNDPLDSGKRTVLGISEANWPLWAGWKIIDRLSTPKEMATTPELQSLVQQFYLNNFWEPIKGDEISSQFIASSIFDASVNMGIKPVVKLVQSVLGITTDGIIGNNTIKAINASEDRLFIAEFKLAKISRYCDIIDAKPNQIKYLKGWCRRALR